MSSESVAGVGRGDRPGSLRQAFARIPTGVSLVTVASTKGVQGITIGSLVSISLEPPLFGFLVGQERSVTGLLRPGVPVTASVLRESHVPLARRMAASGESRVPDQHLCDVGGWPAVRDALAAYHGVIERLLALGDHLLAVVALDEVRLSARTAEPLVFYGSQFSSVRSES